MPVHHRTPIKASFYLRLSDLILRTTRAMVRAGAAPSLLGRALGVFNRLSRAAVSAREIDGRGAASTPARRHRLRKRSQRG